VDGNVVVRDRELLTLDLTKVRARATEASSRLFR
jgi:hypothetical protein